MKKIKTLIPLKYVALVGVFAIVGLIATYVVAWQAPTAAPTGGNVAAPINTGTVSQTKGTFANNSTNFTVLGTMTSSVEVAAMKGIRSLGAVAGDGFVVAQKFCIAPNGNAVLTYTPAVPGQVTCITNWSDITNLANAGLPTGTQNGQMLEWRNAFTSSGGVSTPAGWKISDVINTIGTKVNVLPNWVGINQNIALDVNGRVKIKGGTPAAGKVLTAQDADGNATWSGLSNNVRIFSTTAYPVGDVTKVAYCGVNEVNGGSVNQDQDWFTNGKAIAGSTTCYNTGGSAFANDVVWSLPGTSAPSGNATPSMSTALGSGWVGRCGLGTGATAANSGIIVTVTCVK